MKTNKILFGLSLICLCCFWSCERETITSTDHTFIAPPPGGNGNGNGPPDGNGNNSVDPLYSVEYDGDIVKSQVGMYRGGSGNPKYTLIGNAACGNFAMLEGINELLAMIGQSPCYDTEDFCSIYHHIRQWDKKKNPNVVAAHFIFNDFSYSPNMQQWFTMHGFLEDASGKSIDYLRPPNVGDKVILRLHSWKHGGSICNQSDLMTFASMGLNDQTITIIKLAETDCTVDQCLYITGN